MMKRLTVRRMLKKRLAECNQSLRYQPTYKHLVDVLGGSYDDSVENQSLINNHKDIDEINYLLWCLDNISKINYQKNVNNEIPSPPKDRILKEGTSPLPPKSN